MASKCADTRESRKFSVPTSIKQEVFHEEAEGKFVSPMLFHFSRAFFTGDGRPKMESKYNVTLVESDSQGSLKQDMDGGSLILRHNGQTTFRYSSTSTLTTTWRYLPKEG